MPLQPAKPPAQSTTDAKLKIYFLPNLLTAGNLFCGFLALTRIVEADPARGDFSHIIRKAIFLILLALIFDLFDGRVARMGGHESPFGREFDSLADMISFGAAPAFLVHHIILKDVLSGSPRLSWMIAAIYLICGAFRLARFNCLAAISGTGGGKEFLGFPIPAAAGLVSSLTLFLLWLEDNGSPIGKWGFVLPAIMVFLSLMMVSEVKYPTFKSLDFRAKRTFTKMVVIVLLVACLVLLWEKILQIILPILFTVYLVYGFIRPRISRKVRDEIEEEEESEDDIEGVSGGS
jgi:CDP-diacylglycerol--serine O-phosphatidyltransferase